MDIKEFKSKIKNIFGFENIKHIEYEKNNLIVNNIIFTSNNNNKFKISFENLKEVIGWKYFRSKIFQINIEEKDVIINGKGLGHHLGFCLWGAYYLSNNNKSYKFILNHYFKNCKLDKLNI